MTYPLNPPFGGLQKRDSPPFGGLGGKQQGGGKKIKT
jgi:hypothetical protein